MIGQAIYSRKYGLSFGLMTCAKRLAAIIALFGLFCSAAFAQTGRPVSGVIAATDKPIAISYVNEAGESIGRIAGVGEPIYLNDEITTPDGASLQVLLRDQTVFSIGPNSTLVFDEFIFDPTTTDELALTASVTKGTFKFISGKISKLKPGAMTLKLPNATASVRGTSVVGRVDETGASDIVLLTGAVQLETLDTPALDLVQPGWGISIGETGAASDPSPFAPEDIDTIIQSVELKQDDEAQGEAQAPAVEEEPSEEAVETVAEVVRDAGEEVSVEEITTIIKAADGNPEAVAEAIVKVIIGNKIEAGEINPDVLTELEAFGAEAASDDGGLALPGDFNLESLDVAALKGEDLGIQGFDFGGDDSFVEAFSSRLDTEALALPKFDEANFGFDSAQFEDVSFDVASFNRAEISVTRTFDIKDVSELIIGDQFEGTDTPDIELSFFDILFNAETINKEISRREASFAFSGDGTNFEEKPDSPQDDQAGNFDESQPIPQQPEAGDNVPNSAFIITTQVDENGLVKPVFQRPGFDEGESGTAPEADESRAPPSGGAELVLSRLIVEEPKPETEQPKYEPEFEPEENNKESQEEFALFIERVRLDALSGTLDPLAYYKAGKAPSDWLRLQSDGSVGNSANLANQYDGLISQAYSGTARFADTIAVSDRYTGFSAKAGYDVSLNYGAGTVTGSFALSNMRLNGVTYYGATNQTSHTESFTNLTLQGRDTPSGTFSAGDNLEQVNIATVDFHNATNAPDITSRIRTSLDMSVGSVVVFNRALNGTLGEFTVESEEFTCNPNCTTSTGNVGRAVSVVEGK